MPEANTGSGSSNLFPTLMAICTFLLIWSWWGAGDTATWAFEVMPMAWDEYSPLYELLILQTSIGWQEIFFRLATETRPTARFGRTQTLMAMMTWISRTSIPWPQILHHTDMDLSPGQWFRNRPGGCSQPSR